MPTICNFYGIIIIMRLKDKEHNPPHIHAITQDVIVSFRIDTGELMAGAFPPKAHSLVQEFIYKYQSELMEMWNTGTYKKLPPIE